MYSHDERTYAGFISLCDCLYCFQRSVMHFSSPSPIHHHLFKPLMFSSQTLFHSCFYFLCNEFHLRPAANYLLLEVSIYNHFSSQEDNSKKTQVVTDFLLLFHGPWSLAYATDVLRDLIQGFVQGVNHIRTSFWSWFFNVCEEQFWCEVFLDLHPHSPFQCRSL